MSKTIETPYIPMMEITRTEKYEMRLSGAMLLALLRKDQDIPPGATVRFLVPGGGDYSGEFVDVDNDSPILVTWSVTETERRQGS